MARKIKSGGGVTAPTTFGNRKPEIFQPIGGALPAMGERMTKREARRAGKQAKLDHKRAFDAGQMKTANELTKRMKQLKELY
jgi:hypothetical protein